MRRANTSAQRKDFARSRASARSRTTHRAGHATGLLKTLDDAAGKRIDAAVGGGRITKDPAGKLRTKVDGAIVRIVDHSGDRTSRAQPAATPKPTN